MAIREDGRPQVDADQMHADDFIGEVIGIGRMHSLHIDIDHQAEILSRVRVVCDLTFPAYIPGGEPEMKFFYGNGKTMGYALRECREHIRREVGK